MLFLPAQVLKRGFVTSSSPHMPSLVFEQKYLCRKCILWGTGIPSTPRRTCPEQAPLWLGNTSVAKEQTLCSWLLERTRGEIEANPIAPPWSPTEAHQSLLHPEASPGLAEMLWLLLCEDTRSWHTNELLAPSGSRAFLFWYVFNLGLLFGVLLTQRRDL